MKTRRLLSLLGLLAASTGLLSAALDTRTYSSRAQSVTLNGAACPEVTGWSGGDIAGTVTTSALGGAMKKHISSIGYDPIVVETSLPLSAAFSDTLSNFLSGKNTPQTLTLTTTDFDGKPESTLQATNALIEEVQFPKLDGSSKEPARLTFLFRAKSVKPIATETSTKGPKSSRTSALAANFRIAIDGLPSTRIASIEAFTIKSSTAGRAPGVFNAQQQSSTPNISDLTVAISQSDRDGWTAWRDTFLVQGNSQEAQEKSGTLELLSPDLKTPLFTLKLSNLGLIRLSTPPTEGESIARLQAELYIESASLPTTTNAPVKTLPQSPANLNNIAPIKRAIPKP